MVCCECCHKDSCWDRKCQSRMLEALHHIFRMGRATAMWLIITRTTWPICFFSPKKSVFVVIIRKPLLLAMLISSSTVCSSKTHCRCSRFNDKNISRITRTRSNASNWTSLTFAMPEYRLINKTRKNHIVVVHWHPVAPEEIIRTDPNQPMMMMVANSNYTVVYHCNGTKFDLCTEKPSTVRKLSRWGRGSADRKAHCSRRRCLMVGHLHRCWLPEIVDLLIGSYWERIVQLQPCIIGLLTYLWSKTWKVIR